MPRLRLYQRLFGLLLLATCGPSIWLVWHSALATGRYSRAAAALLPAASVVGFGLALFPLEFDQLPEAPALGDDAPQLPVMWQYLLLAAVLAGLANWYAIALSV
jgi:hypothetical protein